MGRGESFFAPTVEVKNTQASMVLACFTIFPHLLRIYSIKAKIKDPVYCGYSNEVTFISTLFPPPL